MSQCRQCKEDFIIRNRETPNCPKCGWNPVWPCINCGKEIRPKDSTIECPNCGFYVCKNCFACECTREFIEKKGRRLGYSLNMISSKHPKIVFKENGGLIEVENEKAWDIIKVLDTRLKMMYDRIKLAQEKKNNWKVCMYRGVPIGSSFSGMKNVLNDIEKDPTFDKKMTLGMKFIEGWKIGERFNTKMFAKMCGDEASYHEVERRILDVLICRGFVEKIKQGKKIANELKGTMNWYEKIVSGNPCECWNEEKKCTATRRKFIPTSKYEEV